MQAMLKAIGAGKQVSVFIEVKARFDEEANLRWGEKLEKAGVTVHYSFPGVKVHSKLALVRRLEGKEAKLFLLFVYDFLNGSNRLLGTDVQLAFGFAPDTDKIPVVRHSHPKKFIQVRTVDRQEFYSLKKRHRRIFGLLKNAVIKRQPADISGNERNVTVKNIHTFRRVRFDRPGSGQQRLEQAPEL